MVHSGPFSNFKKMRDAGMISREEMISSDMQKDAIGVRKLKVVSRKHPDPAVNTALDKLGAIVHAPKPPPKLLEKLQDIHDELSKHTIQHMGNGIIRRGGDPEIEPAYSLHLANINLTTVQYNEIANLMAQAGILPDRFKIEVGRMEIFINALFIYLSNDSSRPASPLEF